LKFICQNQNRRIREAGLYPPLIDRHTGGQDPQADPQIIGYSANFRIGMFGDQQQKFGIFGDEFHKPKFQNVADNKPRRSVELMRYADSRRNFFDPIACLGAEAPRLDIPPAYYASVEEEGVTVERYSVMAPASVLPGGSNTYLPGNDERNKYQLNSQPNSGAQAGMLSPEDINQLINAMTSVLEADKQMTNARLSTLESAIKSLQAPQQPGLPADPSQPMADGQDPLAIQGGSAGQPPAPPAPSQPTGSGLPFEPSGQAAPDSFPVNQKPPGQDDKFSMLGQRYSVNGDDEAVTEKYSQEFVDELVENHKQLIEETGKLRASVGQLMTERTDAQRVFRLQGMAQKYSAIEANLDEELGRVLYSAGSSMTDEEFEFHCDTIERYAAQSSPPKEMIPDGQVAQDGKVAEKVLYSQEFNDEVVRRCTRKLSSGVVATFDSVAKELATERGLS
jgi:hypothetical protein